MPKSALTGSRIRERRQSIRMKQADLARSAGISASYLNLIEHNRRRIGGKVLIEIARALETEVNALTQGAEEALLETLREASVASRSGMAEVDRIEEFVARFPGWARLVAAQRRQMDRQDRNIESLNDRLTHDPFLAEAMHELLTNVTAIRSTASILANTPEIEDNWRDRFHRNLHEESTRLAEGSEALVSYFDRQVTSEVAYATPLEALESVMEEAGYHLPALESGGIEAAEALIDNAPQLSTPQARVLAMGYLRTYIADAQMLPARPLVAAFQQTRDPAELARQFQVPLPQMMHRLACLPRDQLGCEIGLVVTDNAGTLILRKQIDGFPIPRFGTACALWPIYNALTRPMEATRAVVETPPGRRFVTYSMAAPISPPSFDEPAVFRSSMLVIPETDANGPGEEDRKIGTSCRICPREGCLGRREPTILAD